MSESKKIKELKAQIKKLEKLKEQKQMEIDFKKKMIEIAGLVYGVDFDKIRAKVSGAESDKKGTDGKG